MYEAFYLGVEKIGIIAGKNVSYISNHSFRYKVTTQR
jgi:hypothetical protein